MTRVGVSDLFNITMNPSTITHNYEKKRLVVSYEYIEVILKWWTNDTVLAAYYK